MENKNETPSPQQNGIGNDSLSVHTNQQQHDGDSGNDTEKAQVADSGSPPKKLNFRKRRLSLPKHHLETEISVAAAEDETKDNENGGEEEKLDLSALKTTAQKLSSSSAPLTNESLHNSSNSHHGADERSHHSDDNASASTADEKAHTFRKRRLSLTLNRIPQEEQQRCLHTTTSGGGSDSGAANNDEQPPPTEGSERTAKRQRFLSDADNASVASSSHNLATTPRQTSASSSLSSSSNNHTNKPRILHSAEMIAGPFAPPSPIHHHVLHQQNPLPPSQISALDEEQQQSSSTGNGSSRTPALQNNALAFGSPGRRRRNRRRNSWKQRHHPTEEDKLPFPKHIVGTYSCHGIEPIYDSDYDQQQQSAEGEAGEGEDEAVWGEATHDDDDNGKTGAAADEEKALGADGDGDEQQQQSEGASLFASSQFQQPTAISAKINQDRGGITFPYANSNTTALFAVYDGHGQGGELVSQFAVHEIQRRLQKHALYESDVATALRETFLAVDEALKSEPMIEPFFAGTTACVALLQNATLTLANAGDSRAVLARKRSDTSGEYNGIDLTVDQNPDSPAEMARILSLGGHVSPPPGPGLSARVWLDAEMTQIGLAMARSIGDHAVADVGVIADPEVTSFTVTAKDEFMILASDGVWEFISSQEAVQLVGDHLDELGATKACQALIEAAASKWHEEEGEYRDDITAIVVRLQHLWGENNNSDNIKDGTPTSTTTTTD